MDGRTQVRQVIANETRLNEELDRIFKRSPETFHKFQSEKEFAAKLAKLEMEDRIK
jgi:hypothetical protein